MLTCPFRTGLCYAGTLQGEVEQKVGAVPTPEIRMRYFWIVWCRIGWLLWFWIFRILTYLGGSVVSVDFTRVGSGYRRCSITRWVAGR